MRAYKIAKHLLHAFSMVVVVVVVVVTHRHILFASAAAAAADASCIDTHIYVVKSTASERM